MATFSDDDLTFEELRAAVRVRLFHRYYFDIEKAALEHIGQCKVAHDQLDFPETGERKMQRKLSMLLEDGLTRRLMHQLYRKPCFYIRDGMAIPLLGSTEIGVVDRGSNIIEVKPLTGCNFTCTYCSVDEGKNRKSYDYLVEEEYLVHTAAAVATRKVHPVEFNIGPHGEPTMYPKLVQLVRDLKALPNVGVISMNTNGALLSKALIDDLAAAGMTRINLSIPALDPALAAELAGVRKFPMEHLMEMIAYCQGKIAVLLAPVLIPGKNEAEMKSIVQLSKTIKSPYPTVGIQNYLQYKKGRRPVRKQLPWEEFFTFIKGLEKETGKGLTSTKEEFSIREEKELEKPFRKGQTVEAEIVMPGRYPNAMYAATKGRLINVLVPNDWQNMRRKVKVRIVRDKHSIYKGIPLGGHWHVSARQEEAFGKLEKAGDAV